MLACLYVPRFPLAAWWRCEPELHGQPVLVADGPAPRATVVCVSPEAERLGLVPGLRVAQARTIAAAVVCRCVAPAAERAAQAALGDVADAHSPRVEDAGAGMVYLDCAGLHTLHPSDEHLARALATHAARLGLEVQVGMATTKVAAALAARRGGGIAVIPPGQEWGFLDPLPVEVLAPSPALDAVLRRWGIRTVGALAALPASALATRLGPEALALARRARGEDPWPLQARPAPRSFEEHWPLDHPIDNLEPFVFVLRGLLDRLVARLALRGYVCGDLQLSLGLVTRGRDERTVTVSAPSNDGKALLSLLRLHLEAHPPAAPVATVRLTAVPETLRAAQLDLFRPNGPAPERLAVTLARLTALCGSDRLGSPQVADAHRPDAYGVAPFAAGGTPREDAPAPALVCALRALRPPHALEVFCHRGRPDFVRPAATGAVGHGRVVTAAGPWRVQGDWWHDGTYDRDYYDLQLSDGGVYRVFYDRRARTWFADGVYD